MVGASRCFASEFLQLGGPETLVSVERLRCALHFADFSSADFPSFSAAKFSVISSNLEATRTVAQSLTIKKGEGAARLLAAC
jgi:hypothetical protein